MDYVPLLMPFFMALHLKNWYHIMEDYNKQENVSPVVFFYLADFPYMYQIHVVNSLGATNISRVHTTRLKHRLLSRFPNL